MDNIKNILLAQRGDKEAFAKLYRDFYVRIYRYCAMNMYHEELAEDVCQEVFIRAWKSLPSFSLQNGGTFQAYLYRIARNLIIDLSRKKKEFSLESIPEPIIEDNVQEKIEKEDSMRSLKLSLGKLDEIERQIIILHYLEELSFSEISEVTGMNEGTLRVRSMRILKKLRDMMEQHG